MSCKRHGAPCLVLASGEWGVFHPSLHWKLLKAACPLLQVDRWKGRKLLGGKCSFSLHIYLTKILYRFNYQQLVPKHSYRWCCRIGHKASYRSGKIYFLTPRWSWVENHPCFDQSLPVRGMELCEPLRHVWLPALCSCLQRAWYYLACLAHLELMCTGI